MRVPKMVKNGFYFFWNLGAVLGFASVHVFFAVSDLLEARALAILLQHSLIQAVMKELIPNHP